MPRLLGERVMLREYKADDIGDIRKWVNDAETTRYLSTRFWPPQTMVDSEEFLSRMLQSSHSAYNFVIADRGDERYIGQLDMFQVDWRLRCGELGMVIGSASDRGQGLGREALELMTDERFHGEPVCSVAQLRTPLLLKNLEGRGDLIPIALHRLAARDREKDTQYCETLYHYLTCCHSLKKTSDALYTHRNTVLYRIRRLQEDFAIPLEEPSQHADLLLGVSLILFEIKGPDFFLRAPKNEA